MSYGQGRRARLIGGTCAPPVNGKMCHVETAEPSADIDNSTLLQTLFQEHSRSVLAYAQRLTGDHFTAEDVTQETFLRAWRNTATLRNLRSVRGWLLTVARNIVIDRARAKTVRPDEVTELPVTQSDHTDLAQNVVDNLAVYEALALLSADHRTVLVQLYYFGRTVPEAARALGIPEGTVKSRCHHALHAFRRSTGSGVKEPTT
jgi:RNA polymerase sigma-70 factor (ECF subfamily)